MKIFLAEDDRISLMMLQAIMKKAGYEVASAEDGGQALTLLSQPGAPRIAVLDIHMPVMDGLEVCRRLRAQPGGNERYILILTTSNRPEDVEAGFAAGANDYVGKPFIKRDLLARVRVGETMVGLREALIEKGRELERAESELRSVREELGRRKSPAPLGLAEVGGDGSVQSVQAGNLMLWPRRQSGG